MPGEKKRKITGKNTVDSLDYSTRTLSQNTIQSHQLQEIATCSILPRDTSDQSPIDFKIDATDKYLDLNQFFISLNIKVTSNDGSNLSENAGVIPINNIGYSAFANVELYMNDIKMTEDKATYMYMSYVHHLVKYPRAYEKTALEMMGWCRDEAGKMEDNNVSVVDASVNKAASIRAKLIEKSQTLNLYGRLLFDFYDIKQYIPNNVSLYIRLIPTIPSMSLISFTDTPCKVKILGAKLYVSKIALSPQAQAHYSTLLKRSGFEFPCRRYLIRTKMLLKGEQNMDWSPFLSCRPRRVYLWQISLTAYNGQHDQNAFNFRMFGMRSLQLYLNDVSLPTNVPMQMQDNLKQVYINSMNAINNPDAWYTTFEEFQHGYFLIVADLTKDHSASATYESTTEQATLRILADYKKPLDQAITVFCMVEYDASMIINNGGECQWKR